MPKFTQNLGAFLVALVLLMVNVVWVAHACAHVAAVQAILAGLIAATLRGTLEIISAGHKGLFIWMVKTTQR